MQESQYHEQVIVVLEYKETGGGEIWPVEGRSGTVYGYATRCPKRGTFCHRMPLADFQRCREDIFSGRKISYPPVPDFEIEEDPIVVQLPPAPVVLAPLPELPVIEEISNAEAATILDETSPPDAEPPKPEKPKAGAKRKAQAKKQPRSGKKRSS